MAIWKAQAATSPSSAWKTPCECAGYDARGLEKPSVRQDDPGIRHRVDGHSRLFSAGDDITEFKGEIKSPSAASSPRSRRRPSRWGAVNGTALGGGLELAWAPLTRSRTGCAAARVPEIKRGILWRRRHERLPRAIGVEQACNSSPRATYEGKRRGLTGLD